MNNGNEKTSDNKQNGAVQSNPTVGQNSQQQDSRQYGAYYQHPYYQYPPYQYPNYNYKSVSEEQQNLMRVARSSRTLIFSICIFLVSFLYSEMILRGGLGLSVPILTAIFYVLVTWYFYDKQKPFSQASLLLIVPIAVISLCFLFVDSGMAYFINVLLLAVLMPMQLTAMSGRSGAKIFSFEAVPHWLHTLIVAPFSYIPMPFHSISYSKKDKNVGSFLLKLLLGLFISLPFVAILVILYMSADSQFEKMVRTIIDALNINLGAFLFDLISGFIIAIFAASAIIGLKGGKKFEAGDRKHLGFLDNVAVSAFLGFINLIQILFVIVQFVYLFFNNQGRLPGSGITFSQYARRGFFELCIAFGLVIAIIIFITLFAKRNKGSSLHPFVKWMLTLLALCNFAVFASSVYRMVIYIEAYGLTVLRVTVLWFVTLMAIVLLGIVIKIWIKSLRCFAWVAVSVICMTIIFNALNVDALVARVNVERHLSNASEIPIDIEYLAMLSPSAAVYIEKLIGTEVDSGARYILARYKQRLENKTWRNYTVTDAVAAKIIEKHNISSSDRYNYFASRYYNKLH